MIRKPVQHSLAGIANGVSLKLGGLGTLVFVSPMPQSLRINGDKLSHFFRLVIFRGFNTEIVRRICGLRLRNRRKSTRNRVHIDLMCTADRRLMSVKDISLFTAIGADSLLLQPTSALSSLNRAIRAALPDLEPLVRVELRHHGQVVAERGGHVPKRTMANQLNGSSVAESVMVFWQSSEFITSKCPSQGCQTGPAALSPCGLSR